MTQPNPFAQPAAAAATTAQPNPFGQPQVAPAAPAASQAYAQPSPFGQGIQQAPAAPATPSPFGQPAVSPQAYAPAAPQAAPAQAPAPMNLGQLGVAPPPEPSGGTGADLVAMYSRLVIVFPSKVEIVQRAERFITPEQRAKGNTTQEKMTATVVVLDSGPGTPPGTGVIQWGGNPSPIGGTPHTNQDPLPYVRKGMWLRQTQLIGQLRSYLPQNGVQGICVGRVAKAGPETTDAWYLTTDITPADLATAQTYLDLVAQNRYPHPLAP